VLRELGRGDDYTLSTLHTTVHLGAHADSPSHYGRGAPSIEDRPLDLYIGPCQLLRVAVGRGRAIGPDRLPAELRTERLLLATESFPDPESFNEDFAALSEELVGELHGRGIRLIGIDTPSVDLFASRELPVHRACLKHDIAILEGLALAGVPEGLYELVALPLPLVGFDGSPVRAVLRTLPPDRKGRKT
jgi:arylformamidase